MHVLFLSFSFVGRPKLDLCDSLTFCAGEMARIPPNKPSKHRRNQEPIWSVQLPYSVCETAFSQVGLFLD